MAAITGSIIAATKLLGGAMTKKAAVAGAKNFVKGKAVDTVKNKVTGKGRKKKKGKGGESDTEEPGAITRVGSSDITPSSPMFGGLALPDPVEPKVKTAKPTGKVSFSSISNQLESIVSLTASIESVTGKGIDSKKKRAATARKDKEKAKKREKEESKEGILSGVGGFLGNKAKEAGQKSGIFNFFTQLLLGTIALKLLDLARSLSKTFDSIGDAFGSIITGFKLFGLTIAAISKDLPNLLKNARKLFSKIKFGSRLGKVGTSLKNVLKSIGNLVPKFIKTSIQAIKNGIGAINKGAQALAKGLTLDTRGKGLGANKKGLDKLLGTGKGKSSIGMTRNVKNIRLKHGDEAARMFQGMVDNGVDPKRAGKIVNNSIKSGRLTSAPMRGTLGGGMKGSQLLKGGLKQSGKRALIKFMGKGGAKAVLGTLGRIPIIGPLIVGVASFLETGKLDQALFRAGGALIGGFFGTFIPIPVIGTLMGELIGEYVGDLFYILLRGGGPEALGKKFQDDMKSLLTAGQAAMDWVGDGFKRMYEGIPKIDVFGFGEVPNPLWMANPLNIIQKTALVGKAFFSRDPMIAGQVKDEERKDQQELTNASGQTGEMSEQAKQIAEGKYYESSGMYYDSKTHQYVGKTEEEAISKLSGDSSSSSEAMKTGLRTGASQFIGGSSDYHIDTQIMKSVPMKQKIAMVDQMAEGYAKQGRVMEFSNQGVANERWNTDMSYDEKVKLLERAFAAHSHSSYGDKNSIDYYIPKKDENRFGKSAEGAEILAPTVGGQSATYSTSGGYGNFIEIKDEKGKVLARTGHGDTRFGPKSGTVDLSSSQPTTPELPPPPTPAEVTPMTPKVGDTKPPTQSSPIDLSSKSDKELKSMLDPTMMGAKNPAIFEAAKQARQDAKAQGLTPEQIERKVLEATIQATQGNTQSESVTPSPPTITPQKQPTQSSSGVEKQTSYEKPTEGSPSIMTIPPPQQSSGGGRGRSNTIPSMGSGNMLNSYYRAQLLGFLYKQG